MEIISTFSELSFGEKRRKLSKGGSFALPDNAPTNPKISEHIDEKKPFILPTNIPFRVATFLLRLCGPESGFAFSRSESCPIFGCIARPSLSLIDYAKRLDQLMRCSSEVFIVAAILIQRMYTSVPELFCELSTHRILGTATVIAIKFCEDSPETNAFYASCLGTNVQDLNQMERHFLQHIQYRVFVTTAQFEKVGLQLATIGARSRYHVSRNKPSHSTTSSTTNNTNTNTNTNNATTTTTATTPTPTTTTDENQKNAQQNVSATTPQTHTRQQKRKFKEDN